MFNFSLDPSQVFAFTLALVLGALIGAEREISYRSDRQDSDQGGRAFAGTRSFALVGLFGGLMGFFASQDLLFPGFWPILLGFFALMGLILVVESHAVFVRHQPGITTTISMMLSYFLGVLCLVGDGAFQSIAIVLALGLTMILATKKHLNSLFVRIDHYELLDALKFGVILFIILPLLPNEKFGDTAITQAFFNPYSTWKFVVIMTGIGYIGYLLKKIIGNNGGIQLSGVIGGLISSTAVTSAMAQASKQDEKNSYSYLIATLLANAVMFVRVAFMVSIFHFPLLMGVMIYPMFAIIIVAILSCILCFHFAKKMSPEETPYTKNDETEDVEESPFQIIPALKFAALLVIIQAIVAVVRNFAEKLPPGWGDYSNYIVSFVAGFVDVDAITSTMSDVAKGGDISLQVAGISILLAVAANTVTKVVLAAGFASRLYKVGLIIACSAMLLAGVGVMTIVAFVS